VASDEKALKIAREALAPRQAELEGKHAAIDRRLEQVRDQIDETVRQQEVLRVEAKRLDDKQQFLLRKETELNKRELKLEDREQTLKANLSL